MTEQDNDRYLTDEQAANVLGVSRRTVHRYGENRTIQTRKTGRRTMFLASDVDDLAEDLRTQRRSPDPDEVVQLRNQLQQATYRIGYLESQLEGRLLPDHARQMQDELAATKAREEQLRQQLVLVESLSQDREKRTLAAEQEARAAQREARLVRWLFIIAVIAIAVLVTILAIGPR